MSIKKIFAGTLAAVTIFSFAGASLFSPAPAKAATAEELQAQVAALLAQIAALQGGSSSSCAYTFTTDLTIGSNGEAVKQLQMFLNKKGFTVAASGAGSAGMESTYFGGLTQAALAKYQASVGISPAAGYFGPVTRAKVNAECTTTGGGGTGTGSGTLEGGAGSVDEYDLISGLNNEEVGEDESDVEVAGLEIEVDDGSDLRFTAVRLVFDEGTATSDFEDYADEVSIWLDGEEVGRVDGDEFNDDNDWTKTVSLDDSAIIKAGEIGEMTVAVSGISNLDSNDQGDTWTVDFRQVRFTDADGATISEDPNTATRTFSFESFATAANAEMKIALNESDDDINESRVIDIDDNDETDNVEILSFTVEAEGDSDLMIDDIAALYTAVGFNLNDGVTGTSLWMDGDEIATENITTAATTSTVTFDDLGLEIGAGETAEFVISVDLESTASILVDGDTIMAEIGSTQRNAWDVEDESGEDLANGDRTGTAVGEAHAVYDDGIMVEFVSATAVETFTADDAGEKDQGTFEIKFKATAFDADARIDRSCEEGGSDAAGQGVEYTITNSGSNTTVCTLTAANTDSEDTANTFELDEDVARTFTLTVVATATSTAFAEVALESINWGTATNDTNANYYTFNLDEFKTSALNLAAL